MPNIQSAKKALRQNKRHRTQNEKVEKAWKDAAKNFKKLAVSNKEEAAKVLSDVYAKLDKAAKTNAIKFNKASRLKSRLAKRLAAATK